jgi:hypothetical protein
MLVLMIETPHSLHTLISSFLYIYNAIHYLLLWLQVIRMLPHPDSALWDLRVDVVGVAGGSLLVLMIENPQPLHTHISSFIYIQSVSAPATAAAAAAWP